MTASKKHAPQEPARTAQQAMESSSELPSSFGDSPKRVSPKDITPEHASWADLKVTDVGVSRAECHEPASGSAPQKALAGGSDTAVDAGSQNLPSSQGDSPQEVTPKDITPDDAAWKDMKARELAPAATPESQDAQLRQEALIDEGSELSFPASDPPAALPESHLGTRTAACESEEEAQLDDAIELTFPASDPIAVSQITRIGIDGASNRR